jgi:hypothetical protein
MISRGYCSRAPEGNHIQRTTNGEHCGLFKLQDYGIRHIVLRIIDCREDTLLLYLLRVKEVEVRFCQASASASAKPLNLG